MKKTIPRSRKLAKRVDRRAMVGRKAVIGKNVAIGPYAVIGDNVKIGDGTIVDSFAHVLDYADIGRNCRIFPYAMVGNISQDLKFTGGRSFLVVGDNNIIREFVTMNRGTEEDSRTIIGSNNLFMAYAHVAHDCRVGDNNIFANNATLAGCVAVGDHVVIGGLSAVHQFCRLGDYSIVGGCSKAVQDVPPYSMCDGHPAIVCGLNIIGLKRAGFSTATIQILKKVFKTLFFEDHTLDKAKQLIKNEYPAVKEVDVLLDFLSSSKRGVGR